MADTKHTKAADDLADLALPPSAHEVSTQIKLLHAKWAEQDEKDGKQSAEDIRRVTDRIGEAMCIGMAAHLVNAAGAEEVKAAVDMGLEVLASFRWRADAIDLFKTTFEREMKNATADDLDGEAEGQGPSATYNAIVHGRVGDKQVRQVGTSADTKETKTDS